MPTPSLAPQLWEPADTAPSQKAGDDLSSLVAETGPLTLDAAAECLRQALRVLQRAHADGVIHGDLRPSDMTLDWDGVLSINRWGRAPRADASDDLHRLADVMQLLLLGEYSATSSHNGCELNGASNGQSPLARRVAVPETLVQLHAGLAHADTAGGFASAAEALAVLEAALPVIEDAAAQEVADWREKERAAKAESSSQPEDTIQEPRAAKTEPPRTDRRRAAWVVGSVALTLAAILGAAGYLLLQ
jgi:serine/threonine protein kinase